MGSQARVVMPTAHSTMPTSAVSRLSHCWPRACSRAHVSLRSPIAFPRAYNVGSTEVDERPTRPRARGIRSPLDQLTVDNGPMGECRCAMGWAAARAPPQRHGGRHGEVVEGEDAKTVTCSNSEAS